jgi:hypothetical protein
MPESSGWGPSVEDYARHLAGVLGVADFVYLPAVELKGSATREIGDGLLACGNEGLIMQVKARDNEIARRDTPERAEAWVRKAAAYGLRQANGTRRHAGITPRL